MSLKKKLTLLLGLTVSTLILYSTNTYAVDGEITGETVRLREQPNTTSGIVTNLDQNNKVDVLEKNGDWYKVTYKNFEGYVYGEYVKVNGTLQAETKEEKPEEEQTNPTSSISTQVQEIAVDSKQKVEKDAKLYILPLLSANKVSDIKKDSEVTVLQVINNWLYVISENKTGWIKKQDIVQTEIVKPAEPQSTEEPEKTDESTEQTKPEETKPKQEQTTSNSTTNVKYVNVDNANVRKKPSTDSDHVTTLTLNTEVTILGEEDNWYKIKVGNTEGYIYGKLVSDEKTVKETSRSSASERTTQETKTAETQNEQKGNNVKTENNGSATGADVVAYAKQFLGYPYVSGGNGPKSFDCSGFTKYVYSHFGYSLERTTGGQAKNGVKVEKDNLQAGDILVFLSDDKSQIGHVGIYIEDGIFIHAANPKRGVVTDSMYNSYYNPRYVTARRIL